VAENPQGYYGEQLFDITFHKQIIRLWKVY